MWTVQLLLQTAKPISLDLEQTEIYGYNQDLHKFERTYDNDKQHDAKYAVITDIRLP